MLYIWIHVDHFMYYIDLWDHLLTLVQVKSAVSLQFSSVHSLSHVQLFATPWTAAHQASPSIANS